MRHGVKGAEGCVGEGEGGGEGREGRAVHLSMMDGLRSYREAGGGASVDGLKGYNDR